jgi:hypothetical protein
MLLFISAGFTEAFLELPVSDVSLLDFCFARRRICPLVKDLGAPFSESPVPFFVEGG